MPTSWQASAQGLAGNEQQSTNYPRSGEMNTIAEQAIESEETNMLMRGLTPSNKFGDAEGTPVPLQSPNQRQNEIRIHPQQIRERVHEIEEFDSQDIRKISERLKQAKGTQLNGSLQAKAKQRFSGQDALGRAPGLAAQQQFFSQGQLPGSLRSDEQFSHPADESKGLSPHENNSFINQLANGGGGGEQMPASQLTHLPSPTSQNHLQTLGNLPVRETLTENTQTNQPIYATTGTEQNTIEHLSTTPARTFVYDRQLTRIKNFFRNNIFTLKRNSLIYFVLISWNIIFIPLHLAFEEIDFGVQTELTIVEVVSAIFFLSRAVKLILRY